MKLFFAVITPYTREYNDWCSSIELFTKLVEPCHIQRIDDIRGKVFVGYKLAYRHYEIKDLNQIVAIIKSRKIQ